MLDLQTRERLWQERSARLKKFIELDAPHCITEDACLLLLQTYGLGRVLYQHFRSKVRLELWFWIKLRFWYHTVLRKSEDEIDTIIEGRR